VVTAQPETQECAWWDSVRAPVRMSPSPAAGHREQVRLRNASSAPTGFGAAPFLPQIWETLSLSVSTKGVREKLEVEKQPVG
jgi:hypothetical protein